MFRLPLQGSKRAVYAFQDPYPRVVTDERGPKYAPVGEQELMEPLGYIPQVAHTYAYYDADYGMVNEKQLSISESTTSAKFTGFKKGDKVCVLLTVFMICARDWGRQVTDLSWTHTIHTLTSVVSGLRSKVDN